MACKWFTVGTIRRNAETKSQTIAKDGTDIVITETFVHRLSSAAEKNNFKFFLEARRDSLDALKEIPEYGEQYNCAVNELNIIS